MNLILTLIARLRGHHNTDGVLSSFSKTVARLNAVSERHSTAADKKEIAASRAKNAALAAREEAKRAANAAGKLQSLFKAETA